MTVLKAVSTMAAMSAAQACHRRRLLLGRGLAILFTLLIIGTFATSGTVYADDVSPSAPQRIVCLSPAITQMIRDLDCGDRIVAVGAYDPVAPENAAVVGDLYNIDYEKLLAVRPTHVIMQATAQPLPKRLHELADAHGWQLAAFPIETAADVGRILVPADPDATGLGDLLNQPDRARALKRRMRQRIAALRKMTSGKPRPRTLMVVGFNPITAVGPDTFLHEMLVAAGGQNVLGDASLRYPVLDRERLVALRPEVVVLITPEAKAADQGGEARDPSRELNLPASLEPRFVRLTDPTALLPSTTMPRVSAALCRSLHPELAGEVEQLFRAEQP